MNQFDEAIEDFTVEGTIPPEPARKFAEAALMSDPIKAVWKHLYQFNNCDPARVHVPTLVVCCMLCWRVCCDHILLLCLDLCCMSHYYLCICSCQHA
jgi:hypothetical protein